MWFIHERQSSKRLPVLKPNTWKQMSSRSPQFYLVCLMTEVVYIILLFPVSDLTFPWKPSMPYLFNYFLFCCLKIKNPFLIIFFFLHILCLSSGSLASSCSFSHSIFYWKMTKMLSNGRKKCSVCVVFRCLLESFHNWHYFKTIWLILLLRNYKKPLEQQVEKLHKWDCASKTRLFQK